MLAEMMLRAGGRGAADRVVRGAGADQTPSSPLRQRGGAGASVPM